MIDRITHSGRVLTAREIRECEARLNVTLPTGYRQWMVAHNGGRPFPGVFTIHGLRHNPSDTIHSFVSIRAGTEDYDLESMAHRWRDFLPKGAVPIAVASCGRILVLMTSGQDQGQIYYCDMDEWDGDESRSALFLVAPTFEALLESLHEEAGTE